MPRDHSRLIMELDKHRREINREHISPTLNTCNIDTLTPVVKVVAKARADYMECLMTISNAAEQSSSTPEQIEELRQHRLAYEELVSAANALETVIQRGYVDVGEG